jgi:hypothetical protein
VLREGNSGHNYFTEVVVGCWLFHHRMKLLGKIGREFSGYNFLESAKRLRDRKPRQCSLYVTGPVQSRLRLLH